MILERTLHPDEANQAVTAGKLLETGKYFYRSHDHHGPTLYYAAAAIQKAGGNSTFAEMDEGLLRATPLVAALGTLVLLFLGVRRFAKSFLAAIASFVFLATAPIFVFYATDFIQEMFLAFSLSVMFYAAARYFTRQDGERLKKGSWAIIFGAGAGLAMATKETCVLSFAAIAVSSAILCVVSKSGWKKLRSGLRVNDIVLMAISFFLVTVVFCSSFASDFSGVKRVFLDAPFSYAQRAVGSGASEGAIDHVHAWWWYFKELFCPESVYWSRFSTMPFVKALTRTVSSGWRFTEFPLLLGALIPLLFLKRFGEEKSFAKTAYLFSLLYFAVLLLFYSLIPYKTPWCMLSVVQALALAAAFGIGIVAPSASVKKAIRFSAVVFVFAAVLTVHWRGVSFMNKVPDSTAIPYNYAQASYDVKNLVARIEKEMAPSGETEYAAVVLPSSDTWPIPWYVRKFSGKVGYWTSWEQFEKTNIPESPKCIVVAESDSDKVRKSFPALKNEASHAVRPGVFVRFFSREDR